MLPVYSLTQANYKAVVPAGFVTSFKLSSSFIVKQLTYSTVRRLATSNGKLLISQEDSRSFFIYSLENYTCLSIITINETYYEREITDVKWTPRGNIVFTVFFKGLLSVITESGEVIVKILMNLPQCIYVSKDDVIYLADLVTGLLQSIDDGVTWSVVYKPIDGWRFKQVIKVTTEKSDDFWIVKHEMRASTHKLGVYSAQRKCSSVIPNITRTRDIDLDVTGVKRVKLQENSLLFDGGMNIFVNDFINKKVYLFSKTGQYRCQLMSLDNFKKPPETLAIDSQRQLLYIGHTLGSVSVFNLTYETRTQKCTSEQTDELEEA